MPRVAVINGPNGTFVYRVNHGVYTDPGAEDWTIRTEHDTDDVACYLEAFEALACDLRQGAPSPR